MPADGAPGGSCPIAGVGASAGGLEAFTELLSHLPGDTGVAFVLVQHLDPKHESHLPELLSRVSRMPVAEVTGDTPVVADHVYVVPSGCNLDISGGVLHTRPRSDSGRNMPIDIFLRALAEDRGRQAFGVVLSGSASDGTLGLQAIKAGGGITFAQETRSAKFNGMPASAIAAGVADFVLPPAEIARKLAALAHHPAVALGPELPDGAEVELDRVFRLLRNASGVDFALYNHGTLRRRIRRRMSLHGFKRLQDYIRNLEQNREEARALGQDFFITVTQFFRDPDVFRELRSTVFPALVANREPEDPLRIWVPGCATGEEAYSIALCLTEFLEERGVNVPFQVFATDICEPAIEHARAGVFTEGALAHLSPAQLTRFFTRADRGQQVVKAIRDICVFAKQNLVQDPPFSNVDLISCRNVLIYFGAALQRKALSVLHYALKPAGFLVLGPSESTGLSSELFHQVDKKHKIFRTQPAAGMPAPQLTDGSRAEGRVGAADNKSAAGRAGPDVQGEADRLVLAEYAPAGVVIDDAMNVLQVRGRTGPYLELPPGEPSRNLLKLVREGLLAGLAKAIRTSKETNAAARADGMRIESGGEIRDVAIKVIPFGGSSSLTGRHLLVLFEEGALAGRREPGGTKPASKRKPATREAGEIARLRAELAATRECLESTISDNGTTVQELKSANEEAQAGNEELETAQEELESANEELITLNEELKIRNLELSQVNRDLTNLLESISIPLVMVGRDLRIRRFTRAVEPMLNLIASDVGRSITDLHPRIDLPDLGRLLLDAMEGGDRKPRDIRDSNGCWYSLRILPSLGPDRNIDGAVMMLIDVDAAKRGRDFAEAIVDTVREPLVILNQNLRVVRANKAFYETFRATREDTEERLIYDLGDGQWNIPKLRELLDGVLPAHSAFRDFEVSHSFEHVGRKVMLLNARELFDPNAQARTVLLAIEDTTDRKRAEEALQATNAELQNFAYALTHDIQEPLRMVVSFTQLLARDHGEELGERARQFIEYSVGGALRIEALLNGLLTYWEVTERGRDSFEQIDCNDVLAKTLLNLQGAIEQSGAMVTAGPLPTVLAEEAMLLQLFQNLISNSIKYRGQEPPKIHIAAERNAEGWLFSVRDNGAGIDPQYAERVFGMFKRLHGKEIPGTGIGLALCRKVVERHGGRIWFESEPGQGATFRFTIPARVKTA